MPTTFTVTDVPVNRAADLLLRGDAGALTDIERLAIAILRGGSEGEEAIPALIDEALITYSHGSYRVPVRVIADTSRLLVIATTKEKLPTGTKGYIANQILQALADGMRGRAIVIDSGLKLEFYEVADGPRVEVNDNDKQG